MKRKVRDRLAEICGGGNVGGDNGLLHCDIKDLEAICQEVKTEQMMETNELFRRKRSKLCEDTVERGFLQVACLMC